MFGFACSSSTSFATTTPFALRHGPLPIRSRAFTAAFPSAPGVLRYARHVFPPAFASFASAWQRASAPISPPRSPPLPGLVARKNVMPESCACVAQPAVIAATHSALRSLRFMVTLLDRVGDAGRTPCNGRIVRLVLSSSAVTQQEVERKQSLVPKTSVYPGRRQDK